MNPEDEPFEPAAAEPLTDAELFDTATDPGGPSDDGAMDNPNADT